MKPRLLDLFCGAGGSSAGYANAGFEVVGVDYQPQPRYPHAFIQADVFALNADWVAAFDAIHASPPCQSYSVLRHAPGTRGAPMLIEATRDLLGTTGRPWVLENVEGAPLRDPVLLCGSMFHLGAAGHQLQRHRLFESNVSLKAPASCRHRPPVIGVYGGHARCRSRRHGGRGTRDFVGQSQRELASTAMGIDWMTLAEMSEAIPPVYTAHLGRQLLAQFVMAGSRAA